MITEVKYRARCQFRSNREIATALLGAQGEGVSKEKLFVQAQKANPNSLTNVLLISWHELSGMQYLGEYAGYRDDPVRLFVNYWREDGGEGTFVIDEHTPIQSFRYCFCDCSKNSPTWAT